jgi:hypothetical protein
MPTLLGCKKKINHIHDNASPPPDIFESFSRVYSLEDLIPTTTKYICQEKKQALPRIKGLFLQGGDHFSIIKYLSLLFFYINFDHYISKCSQSGASGLASSYTKKTYRSLSNRSAAAAT